MYFSNKNSLRITCLENFAFEEPFSFFQNCLPRNRELWKQFLENSVLDRWTWSRINRIHYTPWTRSIIFMIIFTPHRSVAGIVLSTSASSSAHFVFKSGAIYRNIVLLSFTSFSQALNMYVLLICLLNLKYVLPRATTANTRNWIMN
jgi:hypothetical protein